MIVLAVGASSHALAIARTTAAAHAIDLQVDAGTSRPDWVVTACASDRAAAMRRYGLPGYRVIVLPGLDSESALSPADTNATLRRMVEIGPLTPQLRGPMAWLARRAGLAVTEWATWLAAGEVRQRRVVHAAAVRSRADTTIKGQVLFVVPDLRALDQLTALLSRLSDQRHRVHVIVSGTSIDDADVSAWDDRYWGSTVSGPSERSASPWLALRRATREYLEGWRLAAHGHLEAFEAAMAGASRLGARLARSRLLRTWPLRTLAPRAAASIEANLPLELALIGVLDDVKPDVVVVVPHRDGEPIEIDVFRAARWAGVPSVLLPLRWDDLEESVALRFETPDVVAVWNEVQRELIESATGARAARTATTGALLSSDIVPDSTVVDRVEYCRKLEIEPTRSVILVEAPAGATRASIDAFEHWSSLVQAAAIPEMRDASIVVYVEHSDEASMWRRLRGSGRIAVARAGTDSRRAPFRLNEALVTAHVVVAVTVPMALEALARGRSVVVQLDEHEEDTEIARFGRAWSRYGSVTIARGPDEIVRSLSGIFASGSGASSVTGSPALARAANGDNGTLQVYRLLNDLVVRAPVDEEPRRPAMWQRLLVLACAALARRFDRGHNDPDPPDSGPKAVSSRT